MPGDVALLRSFELRAWARAVLLRECVFASVDEAFTPLWIDAVRDGLVDQYGLAALMDIIETAYSSVVPNAGPKAAP